MAEEAQRAERPEVFAPGTQIGMHLTVETPLTTGPRRTYYVANNKKPRWYTRICWNCGHKHNPTTAESCVYCQTPLRARRFLLSSRWGQDVRAFHAFATQRLRHPGIAAPIVLYEFGRQVLSFYEMGDEALLVDEPAPMHPRTVMSAAWTLAGGMHHLHKNGVVLDGVERHHVLVHKERARWFDIDVAEVRQRPITAGDVAARRDVCDLARLLADLTPLDQPEMREFFEEAADDVFPGSLAFQREIRAFAREHRFAPSALTHSALSVVGRTRQENEDAWASERFEQADVHLLADGMGGYKDGAQASALAIQTVLAGLREKLPAKPPTEAAFQTLVDGLFKTANDALRALAGDQPMGTTLVLAVVWKDRTVQMAHIGDSRIYRFTGGKLAPITEDHSMVAAMVANGKLSREEARTHPRSNVLLQFLGNPTTPEPDVHTLKLTPADRLVLCSDGVWGELPEATIAAQLASQPDVRRQTRTLVHAAVDAGGKDNTTALVLQVR